MNGRQCCAFELEAMSDFLKAHYPRDDSYSGLKFCTTRIEKRAAAILESKEKDLPILHIGSTFRVLTFPRTYKVKSFEWEEGRPQRLTIVLDNEGEANEIASDSVV